jgi:hypothetical protein
LPKTTTDPAIIKAPGKIARVSCHDNQAPAHRRAYFVAGVAFNNDQSPVHSSPAAPVGASQAMSRIPPDMNTPSRHLSAGPVTDISKNMNFAAAHPGPKVHPGIAVYSHFSLFHSRCDVFDPAQVAIQDDFLRPIALDVEEVA